MMDGVKPTQREIKAMEIAMAGADVKGAMDKARTGKNGFVIQHDGKEIKLRTLPAIGAVMEGGKQVQAAWANYSKALEGLPPEQAKAIEEAGLLFAGLCSSIGGEVSRKVESANRTLNSRDADELDDIALYEAVVNAPGKLLKDRLAHVMEQRGEDPTDFDTFKRTYYRIKKRLNL